MSQGVIYIATGEEFVKEAIVSAEQLTGHSPDLSITLISDRVPEQHVFEQVLPIENPDYGFTDKIAYMSESPYDRTLYLDTDVYVTADVERMFPLLDQFDIAATHDQNLGLHGYTVPDIPDAFPEYNTGVLLFNTAAVKEFFNSWEAKYDDSHPHDQPSFRQALYRSDKRVATLPREYNCMVRFPGHVVKKVQIFHGRMLDLDSPGAPKLYDIEKAAKKINKRTGHRVYVQGGRIVGFPRLRETIHNARHHFHKYGLKATIEQAVDKFR